MAGPKAGEQAATGASGRSVPPPPCVAHPLIPTVPVIQAASVGIHTFNRRLGLTSLSVAGGSVAIKRKDAGLPASATGGM